MSRKLVVRAMPSESLPDMMDPRWRYWSRPLAELLHRNPVDWVSLLCFGELTRCSGMAVRQMIAYLEDRRYAVSFTVEGTVRWCGCGKPCGAPAPGCPKLGRGEQQRSFGADGRRPKQS